MTFFILVLLITFSIYLPWFDLTKTLSSGDWPYLYPENIASFKFITEPPFLWLEPYYQITAKLGVQVLSLSWETTEKISWFLPFLALSLVSSYLFLKYIATRLELERKSLILISLGSLIFTTNTYILMLTGGGQMGVAMAYSLMPHVLLGSFKFIDFKRYSDNNFQFSIFNFQFLWVALVLATQLMFDPRIFALSMFIVFLYSLFMFVIAKNFNVKALKKILFVLFFSLLVNFFWILPNLDFLNSEYKTIVDAVGSDFLSFATLPNTISLLHPNWPENIFGKIGFMKPEFLFLPILAYSSLLFLNSKVKIQGPKILKNQRFENNLTIEKSNNRKITILFFAFLGLIGAFLAKGTNPPFGELYTFLSNIPGFMIFRDPTKFYLLIVISYTVLIPFSLYKLSEKVSSIKPFGLELRVERHQVLSIFTIVFIAYWLFLIRPAVFGQLGGTFNPHETPKEYLSLKNFLNNQSRSFKTLWVPHVERFGFSSKNHLSISSVDFFKVSSLSQVLNKLEDPNMQILLNNAGVRYVIIPYDYLGELFLTDREYNDSLYRQTLRKIRNIKWLSEIKDKNFGKIGIFELDVELD